MMMPKRRITISSLPTWLPAQLQTKLQNSFVIKLSTAECKIYYKRQPIKASAWAEKHRYVTSGPLAGGKWSNKLTPYLKGIMDASFFPSVREIIICKAVQVGGTTAMETCIAYAADRRPGPALVVYPDRDTARANNRDNLQPMIKSSPCLKSLMTGVDDDISALRIKLTTMLLYMGWSGSATSLGNKSVMYLVLDEIDKYTLTPNKKEAATIDLAEKRNTAYPHDYKRWKTSTPTVESGPIWQALNNDAQVIFEYWGKCPVCGALQWIKFGGRGSDGSILPGGIRWPGEERDHKKIENEKLAWYECEHCAAKWSDHMRDRAVRHGQWRARKDGRELFKYLRQERPAKIGFHLPAWISPFVSLSESAARFIKGQKDTTALKDFCNNYSAEPWLNYKQDRKEDKILALCDDRPDGIVPGFIEYIDPQTNRPYMAPQVSCLLAGVDVHGSKKGFYITIIAVGYGMLQNQWIIKHTIVDSFAAVAEVLWQHQYCDKSGNVYPIQLTLIDSRYRTKEVYDFCLQHRGQIIPAMGKRTMPQPYSFTAVEYYPDSVQKLPGGLKRVMVNTTYFKDNFSDKLDVDPGAPGSFRLNSRRDDELAAHLCSEARDEQMFWVPVTAGRPTHFLDCCILSQVAADIKAVKLWPPPAPPATIQSKSRVLSKGIEA